ncbi:hypothetical protein BD410DRAFT_734824 [Rickenella mellea]|uniref:Thioesterase domain-containing protein n=1 Tax=Rickenella mellea TaxID=50990 RepID=A0A4Y7PER8_9AGAM|nr:hypothetical protein BD410DRAFT_734824 [Rickenella mellea]
MNFDTLPDVPDDVVRAIKGNITDDAKRLNAKVLSWFIGKDAVYSNTIGKRIRITEINVVSSKHSGKHEAEAICELRVEDDMVNTYGTLHGGCTAYVVDICSSIPLIALGIEHGVDGSGMSQSINIMYHASATSGTALRIVSTTMVMKGRVGVSRCELWDKEKKRLVASGIHSKFRPSKPIGNSAGAKL